MEYALKSQERRKSIRHNMIYPVIYTRFDDQGRPFDQKPSKSTNVSLGGIRMQSDFPVQAREALELSIALGNNLITFMGKVTHVTLSDNEDSESGISIEGIDRNDRVALTRFFYYLKGFRYGQGT